MLTDTAPTTCTSETTDGGNNIIITVISSAALFIAMILAISVVINIILFTRLGMKKRLSIYA